MLPEQRVTRRSFTFRQLRSLTRYQPGQPQVPTVIVVSNGNTVAQGTTVIEPVTPGLFAANANGQGVASAIAVRVKSDNSQTVESVLQQNQTTNQYDAVPLAVGDSSDQLFLILFGTGFPVWHRLSKSLVAG